MDSYSLNFLRLHIDIDWTEVPSGCKSTCLAMSDQMNTKNDFFLLPAYQVAHNVCRRVQARPERSGEHLNSGRKPLADLPHDVDPM